MGHKGPSWAPVFGPQGPLGPQLGPWIWAPRASRTPAGASSTKKIERHRHDFNYRNNKRIKIDDTKVLWEWEEEEEEVEEEEGSIKVMGSRS